MLLAAPAFAITQISTGPVFQAGANRVSCEVTNVSSKTITVDMTVFEGTGMALAQGQATLGPFQSADVENTPNGASEFLTCVFLFPGSAKQVRASLVLLDNNLLPLVALPAS
jgi:hypothetical protein